MNRTLQWALTLACCSWIATAPAPAAQLDSDNHWVANTGGRKTTAMPEGADPRLYNGNAANHLTGIGVREDLADGPVVLTTAEYDETGLGNAPDLGAVYQDGVCLGKSFWPGVDSRTATNRAGTLTATVRNFYGRGLFFDGQLRLTPPPTGADAPYVELSDGRTIRSVEDPTAVSFDLNGRLWIADNGPDQNIKIFDVPATGAPVPAGSFGEPGGVFAGPLPGAWGAKRFWGPVGVAHDSLGNIYVGSTGMSSLMMGGTDIRAFAPDGSLLWKVNGTFTNTADAAPASDGTSIHLNAKRYAMDYTKAPGASWSFAAVTLDPFRYPEDARLQLAMESVWAREIDGRRFLFLSDMFGAFCYVVRFEAGSEVGIPTAFFWLGQNGRTAPLWSDMHPTWEGTEANKNLRWRWLDTNGDGHPQPQEFETFSVSAMLSSCVSVDDAGTIWYGGRGSYWAEAHDGGLTRIPAGGLDAHGVPHFPLDAITHPDVPFTEYGQGVLRLRYLAASDTMFFSASLDSWYDRVLYRYDHFSDPARRTRTLAVDLGYDDLGLPVHLDQGTDVMTIPHGFTADEDYIYVVYLDNGPDARVRGEVTIYDAHDGHKVGWIVPGDETGHSSGATDLLSPINVRTRANGDKIIMVEENGAGKVMVYRWTPPGEDAPPHLVSEPPEAVTVLRSRPVSLQVTAEGSNLVYQWRRDGAAIEDNVTAHTATLVLSGDRADNASYECVITGSGGTITSRRTTVQIVNAPGPKLINLSTRSHVGSGERIQIAGFVVQGPASKHVLLRAAGPALGPLGVAGYAPDPRLQLLGADGMELLANNDWPSALAPVFHQCGAFSWEPGSADAALEATLAPGLYTALVSNASGADGVALVEIYDLDEPAATSRAVNVSTRAWVGAGDAVEIAGFVIEGSEPKTVLVRACGPSLAARGIGAPLADPVLTILDTDQTPVAANDDWDPSLTADFQSVGAFPLSPGSPDAAVVVTLEAGAYTAIVSGRNGTEGVALVEVYELP